MKIAQGILIGIFFLTVLYSCSIEKRIHTSGYHVEWSHKKLRSENNSKTIIEVDARIADSKTNVEEDLNLLSFNEQSSVIEKTVTSEPIVISTNTIKTITQNTFQISPRLPVDESRKSEINSLKHKIENSPNDAPKSGGRMSGVYILLLALLFLLLAFVFYTYLGVFGMIFGIIFGIAATILLIYGLIKIIIG